MSKMRIHQREKCKAFRWQVIFSFLFSCFYFASAQIKYSIFEEMKKGSLVGNLAKDMGLSIKELSRRKFHISPDAEKYFSFNIENGNLYISGRIDREILCPAANPCFLTFDALVENPLNVFHVTIEIKDLNDNAPKFLLDIIRLDVVEFTSPGARFLLQNARDTDIGVNSIQSYQLNDNDFFSLGEKINSDGVKYPEIVLEKSLDREKKNLYELTLTAFDGGNPMKTGTVPVKIFVTDANDNFPIFTQEIYRVMLNENVPIDTSVLQVKASDKDEGPNAQISYSFSNTVEDVLNVFAIDNYSGEIKTKGHIDFEVTKSYEMSVQAQDGGGLVSHANVVVQIVDLNDNAPKITITSISSPISEDSLPGSVVALINVHDKDSGENGEIMCQILDSLSFKLLPSSGDYYKIVTSVPLDREKTSSYNISIVATDKGSPPLSVTKTIELYIADVNDNPPTFESSAYDVYITENNLPGASIYRIHASDLDYGDNSKLVYAIITNGSEDFPVSAYLSINPVTGVLYAQQSFDYEHRKTYYIQIMAKDSGSPALSSSTVLRLCIVDQNDNAPTILYPSPENENSALFEVVPLASEPGYLVTKVVAVDADTGHNAWLSYHFIQASEPFFFTIGQNTGEIRTSRVFEEKDSMRQKVVVMVKDNGDPSLSATATLHLVVAEHFQHVLPGLNSQPRDTNTQYNPQLYLVIALVLISFLFLLTLMLAIISKYKKLNSPTSLNSLNPNLFSQVDPRLISRYSTGTLPLPISYDVCVALDSNESDFSFLKPNHDVPVASLIDADNSETGNEIIPASNAVEQAQPNTDWRFSQAQRPGPSGAQPTEEAGVWPNNQFETERLQAMILASANEAAEGSSALGGGTGTMGLSARYGPQFTLQHVPDYRQNIYIPGTTSTLTNAAGKRDGKAAAPSGGNKKKSGKKDKK
ncbi:protocadherin gamma-B2-like isoform X17 [Spea bombifrons]|uniref:protocadherin gamma-B2-like isoform X17 n=1 Tax=Spea bombifrons TaxID=233779 RepID=UPI00234BBBAF|nr:protocadherin gamma-B2-like isoform X17 [Spea bombifrons]